MSSTNPMLRLPAERIDQLKALTAALGLSSAADTIGHLIREQVARKVIPDTVPGFDIHREKNGVSIRVGDAVAARYPRPVSAKIASAISQVADGTATGIASIDDDYIVMRQGNGVRLHFPLTAPAKSVSPDVARDIGRLIAKACS